MKIRAITAVDDGKNYYQPGDEWDCRKKDAEGLVACGAAEVVVAKSVDDETKAPPAAKTEDDILPELG